MRLERIPFDHSGISAYKIGNKKGYKKLYKWCFLEYIEDDHNSLETPVPIPNTEVKQTML